MKTFIEIEYGWLNAERLRRAHDAGFFQMNAMQQFEHNMSKPNRTLFKRILRLEYLMYNLPHLAHKLLIPDRKNW